MFGCVCKNKDKRQDFTPNEGRCKGNCLILPERIRFTFSLQFSSHQEGRRDYYEKDPEVITWN